MSIIPVYMYILIVMCRVRERERELECCLSKSLILLYHEHIETYVASIFSLILRKYMLNRLSIRRFLWVGSVLCMFSTVKLTIFLGILLCTEDQTDYKHIGD